MVLKVDDENIRQDMDSTSNGSGSESCLFDIHEDDEDEGDDEYQMTILCELVGARDLILDDYQELGTMKLDTLQPFCIVKLGDRIIHTSRVAPAPGPNPIWTLSSGSFFLLRASPREWSNGILNIGIYSQRGGSFSSIFQMDSNRLALGYVSLDSNEILSKCGQRFEMQIKDNSGEQGAHRGRLALRFQVATESDQQIVGLFSQDVNLSKSHSRRELKRRLSENTHSRTEATLCTEIDEREVAQDTFVNALNNVCSTRSIIHNETGTKLLRVKPYPDPHREGETAYMSPEDIVAETWQASHKWVDGGSGNLGKVYCEVLACHDLPNVDVGDFMGNVTDPFVCLVYEDTCAMTDVINDELSPRWLPWTQRAFCFGMMHPSSVLYIGVFDYDLGTSHEPLGRVAVNISNLQRNTIHTLKFSLYRSSNVTDRTAVGSITIRVRIECPDEKAALLVALQPRPKIFVNVKQPKSFPVIRYTCYGEYDGEEKFDMTVMRSYINEMFEYKGAFGYAVRDAFTSLVFWRGQVEVCSLMIPIYSMVFFCMAADFVERPFMLIPYLCFGISGMMLATLTVRRQHPSPWNRCPSFLNYLHVLVTGKAPPPVAEIREYEGYVEATAYEKAWQDRVEKDLILAEKQLKRQQELDEFGDDNIATKTSPTAIPVDILARLTRYQGMAGRYCGYMRFVKVIVTWEESMMSFWITAVFLITGLTTMLLPWRFILTWTGRLVVWCLLGPHMKLVDLYRRAHQKDGMLNDFMGQFDLARVRREEALKKKDVKAIAFGKYSTQVPAVNIGTCFPSRNLRFLYSSLQLTIILCQHLARHFDRPLPESSARICRQRSNTGSNRRVSVVNLDESQHIWIPGQQLFGEMIPRPEREARLHEIELLRQAEKVERFRSLVKLSTERRGVEATRENMLGSDLREPVALGYEIIHDFQADAGNCDDRTCTEVVDRRGLAVVLTCSGQKGPSFTEEVELLTTSDHITASEQQGTNGEEEVGEFENLGSYKTVSFDHSDGTEVTILGRHTKAAQDTAEAQALSEKGEGLLPSICNVSSNFTNSECDTSPEVLVQSQTI